MHQHSIDNVSISGKHIFATLFTENFFAASYQRFNIETSLLQQELQVIELFSPRYEDDTKSLLMAYWKGNERVTGTEYSSFKMESKPKVVAETYVLTFGVKAIALTETAHHIAGRAMVLLTSDNKVYTISEKLFSARRPHEAVQKTFAEELQAMTEEIEGAEKPLVLKSAEFPKYEPVLAQNNKKFLSYDLELIGLKTIQTFDTRLESTTQVFAYGHDLFLTRFQPDKGFDMLDEDFNHIALFVAIAALCAFDIFATRYLQKRDNRKAFLIH